MKKFIQFSLFALLITFGVNALNIDEDFDPVQKPQQPQRSLDQNLFFHKDELNQQHLQDIRTVHQEDNEKGFSRWTRFSRALDHGRQRLANALGIPLQDNPKTVLEEAIQTNTEKFKNNFNFLPQIRKSLVTYREDFSDSNPFEKMDRYKINTFINKYVQDKYLTSNVIKNSNIDLTFLNNTAESDSFKKLSAQEKLEFINEYAKKLEIATNAINKNQTEYYELKKIELNAIIKAIDSRIKTLEKGRNKTEAIKNNSDALARRIQDSRGFTKWLHQGHKLLHDKWHGTSLDLQDKFNSFNDEIEDLKRSSAYADYLSKTYDEKHSEINNQIKTYYTDTLQKLMTDINPFISEKNLIIRFNQTTDKFEFHNKNKDLMKKNNKQNKEGIVTGTVIQDNFNTQLYTPGSIPGYGSTSDYQNKLAKAPQRPTGYIGQTSDNQ